MITAIICTSSSLIFLFYTFGKTGEVYSILTKITSWEQSLPQPVILYCKHRAMGFFVLFFSFVFLNKTF